MSPILQCNIKKGYMFLLLGNNYGRMLFKQREFVLQDELV